MAGWVAKPAFYRASNSNAPLWLVPANQPAALSEGSASASCKTTPWAVMLAFAPVGRKLTVIVPLAGVNVTMS